MSEPLEQTIIESSWRSVLSSKISQAMDEDATRSQLGVEASEIVFGAMYGYLRGRMPAYASHPDLLAVGVMAGIRVARGLSGAGTVRLSSGLPTGVYSVEPWQGFTLSERVILNRYRQTTC